MVRRTWRIVNKQDIDINREKEFYKMDITKKNGSKICFGLEFLGAWNWINQYPSQTWMAWHFQRAFTIPFYFRALHDGMEYGPGSYRIANMQELNRRGCFNKGACVREADRSTFRMGRSPPRVFNTCLFTTTVEANSPIFPSFPTSNFQLQSTLQISEIAHDPLRPPRICL
jgi:hypothetical protein